MTNNRTSSKLANSLRRAQSTAAKNVDTTTTPQSKPPQKSVKPADNKTSEPSKVTSSMPSKRVWPD